MLAAEWKIYLMVKTSVRLLCVVVYLLWVINVILAKRKPLRNPRQIKEHLKFAKEHQQWLNE